MKCKICGFRTNTLPAMSKHYRKKHPQRMKERKHKRAVARSEFYDNARERIENALRAFAESYNRSR